MATLNKETIQQLTRLCRIDCTPEEQEHLLTDLKKILDYIEQLNEIDTKDVPPCSYVLEDHFNGVREDEIGTVLDRETFLANAPSHVAGLVRVPTVIKQQ
jgi:aspartyl-tRNA(Asn)/glutamyl-tRNA(Gln) amidotransferase subunit C